MECEVLRNGLIGSGEPVAVCERAVVASCRTESLVTQALKAKCKTTQGSACAPWRTFCLASMQQFLPNFPGTCEINACCVCSCSRCGCPTSPLPFSQPTKQMSGVSGFLRSHHFRLHSKGQLHGKSSRVHTLTPAYRMDSAQGGKVQTQRLGVAILMCPLPGSHVGRADRLQTILALPQQSSSGLQTSWGTLHGALCYQPLAIQEL